MSAKTSQITSLTIVYSTVYSAADQRKHQSSASLVGEFPAQRASNAENLSIWWCHHAELGFDVKTKNNKKVPRIRFSAHPNTPRLKTSITWHSGKIYSSPFGQNVAQMLFSATALDVGARHVLIVPGREPHPQFRYINGSFHDSFSIDISWKYA